MATGNLQSRPPENTKESNQNPPEKDKKSASQVPEQSPATPEEAAQKAAEKADAVKTEASQARANVALETREKQTAEKEGEALRKLGEQGKESIEKGERPEGTDWLTFGGKLALGLVGATGAYLGTEWALNKLTGEKAPKSADANPTPAATEPAGKERLLNKIPGWAKITAGITLFIGVGLTFFKGSDLLKWFEDQWAVKWGEGTLDRFMKAYQEKGIGAAIDSVQMEPLDAWTKDTAKAIGITGRTLLELKDLRFETFKAHHSAQANPENAEKKSYMDWCKEQLAKHLDPKLLDKEIPNIPFTDKDDKLRAERDQLRRMAEEEHLLDYITTEAKRLQVDLEALDKEKNGDLSIQTILETLQAAANPNAPLGNNGEDHDPQDPTNDPSDALSEDQEDGVDGKKPELIRDPGLAQKFFPQTVAGFHEAQRILTTGEDLNGHTIEDKRTQAAVALIEGVVRDGGAIVSTPNLGIVAIKGGSALFLTSCDVMGQTITDVLKTGVHFLSGDIHEGVTAGVQGIEAFFGGEGKYYLGAGVSIGIAKALWNKNANESTLVALFKGLKKGSVRGLLYPLGTLQTAAEGLATAYHYKEEDWSKSKEAEFKFKNLFKFTPAEKEAILKERAIWNAERYLYYYGKTQNFHPFSREGLMKWLVPSHYDRLAKLHFEQLQDSYESLTELREYKQRLPFDHHNFEHKREEIAKWTKGFLETETLSVNAVRSTLDDTNLRLQPQEMASKTPSENIQTLKQSHKESDDYLKSMIKRLDELKKRGAPQSEIDALTAESRTQLEVFRTNANRALQEIKADMPKMSKEEKAALKELLTVEMKASGGIRAVAHELKGHGAMSIVFGVASGIINLKEYNDQKGTLEREASDEETPEKSKEELVKEKLSALASKLGLDTVQTMIDVASPFGLSDWYTLAMGQKLISGEKVDGWGRLGSLLFGTYSAATDAVAALGGAATAEVGGVAGMGVYGVSNALEASLRASGHAPELIAQAGRLLPEVVGLAHEAGGWTKLLPMLKEIKSVSGMGVKAVMAYQVGSAVVAGYHVAFDTRGQTSTELDFGEDKTPELSNNAPQKDSNSNTKPSETPKE